MTERPSAHHARASPVSRTPATPSAQLPRPLARSTRALLPPQPARRHPRPCPPGPTRNGTAGRTGANGAFAHRTSCTSPCPHSSFPSRRRSLVPGTLGCGRPGSRQTSNLSDWSAQDGCDQQAEGTPCGCDGSRGLPDAHRSQPSGQNVQNCIGLNGLAAAGMREPDRHGRTSERPAGSRGRLPTGRQENGTLRPR